MVDDLQNQEMGGELTELFYIMDIDGSGELEKIEFVQGMMTMLKQVDAKDILSVTGRLNIVRLYRRSVSTYTHRSCRYVSA